MKGFESLASQQLNLNSLLSERTAMLERSEQKLRQLREQDEDDAKLRTAIAHMEESRKLLMRTGLPGVYLREKFQQIVELTRFYLQKTDANFLVYPTEKGLSFSYIDPERDPKTLFPMEKLSGGQRVRLSVAFMLAASQLMIPTFKFLSFDEPSTHLDEEGAESMVDLLQSLQTVAAAGNQQVLVIDHVPEFVRAFTTSIQL